MTPQIGYREFMERAGGHLELKLELEEPLEATGFAEMIGSLAAQFDDYVMETQGLQGSGRFYVREVRQGSIIIDFGALVVQAADSTLIMRDFTKRLAGRLKRYISRETDKTDGQRESEQVVKLLSSVAKNDGKMSLAYRHAKPDGETVEFAAISGEAREGVEEALRRTIEHRKEQRDNIEVGPQVRALMTLYQHNKDPNAAEKRSTGHKAIITQLDKKPRALTYELETLAEELADILEDEPYSSTIFDVTVASRFMNGKLKAFVLYKIHGWFPDDDEEPPALIQR